MHRRTFTRALGAAAAALTLPGRRAGSQRRAPEADPALADPALPASVAALRPFPGQAVPIAETERRARVERARQLMAEHGLDALFLESGSSLFYFTGVRWGLSERLFGLVIPRRGELAYVAPGFEEQRARERVTLTTDVRVWQEDESPTRLVAQLLRERGAGAGRIGVEEQVRFFVFDGLRQELPQATFVSGTPVTAGCRMLKSPAEIALLQRSNEITAAAYAAVFAGMREGMTQFDFARELKAAYARLGAPDGSAGAQFGTASAFPHGSQQPQRLRESDIVLVDGGCTVEGYWSDITRTTVFGTPTARQRQVWELERRAQDAAFRAARIGAPCESVDAAARKVITDAGFGPGYKVPGLPHRTGHGIGLDMHEWTNLVRGNTTPLAPGMCFSDEPMIAIYGEFGVRLEDCFHMTDDGPKFFTAPSPSIDRPFA